MITLPMFDAAYFNFSIILSENEYFLNFKWNTHYNFWTMDIYDLDESPIYLGIKLVIGFPLLLQRGFKTVGPPGDFWIIDSSLDNMFVEPGRYDFTNNRGLELIYTDERIQ